MAIPETPEINAADPTAGTATTASVRRNFAWLKAYLEQLQQALEDHGIVIPPVEPPVEPDIPTTWDTGFWDAPGAVWPP